MDMEEFSDIWNSCAKKTPSARYYLKKPSFHYENTSGL